MNVDRLTRDLSLVGLPEIPVISIHDQNYATSGLEPHRHPGLMEICYLTRGERIYHVNNTDHRFRGNEVFVTLPDELHGSGRHPHGKGLLYYLQVKLPVKPAPFLTLSAGDAWPLVCNLRKLPHRKFLGDRMLKRLFEEIITLFDQNDKALIRIEIAARLIQWMILVVRCSEAETGRRNTPDIRKVLTHIESTLEDSVSIPQLAAVAQLSHSRFKSKFKEQIGMPPAEYVLRRKVEKARHCLQQGRSVTDTAYQFGFSSSQYFASVFKRLTNVRPGDVQNNQNDLGIRKS
jgi:AraC-like DNA-binding protein